VDNLEQALRTPHELPSHLMLPSCQCTVCYMPAHVAPTGACRKMRWALLRFSSTDGTEYKHSLGSVSLRGKRSSTQPGHELHSGDDVCNTYSFNLTYFSGIMTVTGTLKTNPLNFPVKSYPVTYTTFKSVISYTSTYHFPTIQG